ncbi:TPA: hypothetical protein G8O67_004853 [Salmonella enterica]|uniref:Uncharacterized protein n=1 Tax=Salmonella enterica TaxID=28901 RepID=A0A756LH26_SALER|nr:hypothetical protein [Salmonella enterica]HAG0017467.1 hypothetical protein [Salmonella enterica]
MSQLLHLRCTSHELPDFSRLLQESGAESLSVRDLTREQLQHRTVLLIEAHIDQRALMAWCEELEEHLVAGGLIVFNGHLAYPLFDGLELFRVAASRRRDDLVLEKVHEHPVFADVDSEHLSFRRGVAGFYARGGNPPPSGATVIHRLKKDGTPVDWIWRRPQGGVILMHSGNNMWLFQNDGTSASRIAPQLLTWMLEYIASAQR